jgi:sulfur-carrier protein
VTVHVPSPLQSYTAGKAQVTADGRTLAELVDDLDRRYPGIRFRMIDEQGEVRPHMRIFVNLEQADHLALSLADGDEVHILQALSGG